MSKKDIIIEYVNGNHITISECDTYEYKDSLKMFIVAKNNINILIPRENVTVIGYYEEVLR